MSIHETDQMLRDQRDQEDAAEQRARYDDEPRPYLTTREDIIGLIPGRVVPTVLGTYPIDEVVAKGISRNDRRFALVYVALGRGARMSQTLVEGEPVLNTAGEPVAWPKERWS